jgi:hypothetical protein
VAALLKIGHPPYTGDDWRKKFLTERRFLARYGGEYYGSRSGAFGVVLRHLLVSREYTLADRVNVFRGIFRSLALLFPELAKTDLFLEVPEVQVPVYFCLGRHDYEVPSVLAARYFDALRAPRKQLLWFEHSSHMPNTEERDAFNRVMVETVLPALPILGRRAAMDRPTEPPGQRFAGPRPDAGGDQLGASSRNSPQTERPSQGPAVRWPLRSTPMPGRSCSRATLISCAVVAGLLAGAPGVAQSRLSGGVATFSIGNGHGPQSGLPVTGLLEAIRKNDVAAVEAILRETPSSVNARDEGGGTALHLAARLDRGAIVDVLLDHGADARAKDPRGRTPLSLCIAFDFYRGAAARVLVARQTEDALGPSERARLLHRAARQGDEVVVRALIERGADTDAPNGNGGTLLHSAAAGERARDVLLEDDVEVRPPEAKGGHGSAAAAVRRPLPWLALGVEVERDAVERNIGVRLANVDGRRASARSWIT